MRDTCRVGLGSVGREHFMPIDEYANRTIVDRREFDSVENLPTVAFERVSHFDSHPESAATLAAVNFDVHTSC